MVALQGLTPLVSVSLCPSYFKLNFYSLLYNHIPKDSSREDMSQLSGTGFEGGKGDVANKLMNEGVSFHGFNLGGD